MTNEKPESKLAQLKKSARRVTTQETIEAGLEVLEATGLPIEEVEQLARREGFELEDVAYTLGRSRSGRQVNHPVRITVTSVPPKGSVEESVDSPEPGDRLIEKNGLIINLDRFTVTYKGKDCFLGNTILFGLFMRLAARPGYLVAFNKLIDDVWKDDQTEITTVGRTIRLLRDKLKTSEVTGIVIENLKSTKLHASLKLE